MFDCSAAVLDVCIEALKKNSLLKSFQPALFAHVIKGRLALLLGHVISVACPVYSVVCCHA